MSFQFWKSIALSATVFAAIGASSASAQTATLEELAGRLLGYGFDEPELIVGKLPAASPLELPLPTGARVVGSAVRGVDDFQVVVDVRDTPEGIQSFYARRLTGFQSRGSTMTSRGGFVDVGTSAPYVNDNLYCRDDGLSVSVVVYRLDAAIKDLRLQVNTYDCQFNAPSSVTVPNLLPPNGAEVRELVGGYGGDLISSIKLSTSSSPLEVYNGYAQQLQDGGWKLLETTTLKVGMLGSFEFQGGRGVNYQLVLLVTTGGDGQVSALLLRVTGG